MKWGIEKFKKSSEPKRFTPYQACPSKVDKTGRLAVLSQEKLGNSRESNDDMNFVFVDAVHTTGNASKGRAGKILKGVKSSPPADEERKTKKEAPVRELKKVAKEKDEAPMPIIKKRESKEPKEPKEVKEPKEPKEPKDKDDKKDKKGKAKDKGKNTQDDGFFGIGGNWW